MPSLAPAPDGGAFEHAALLIAEATSIKMLNAHVVDATDIGTWAVLWALRGVPVMPVKPDKSPVLRHGFLDATTDLATVVSWWSGRFRGLNIGGRVPENVVVVDIDPRHGGDKALAELERRHGPLPEVFGSVSGRGDGGRHYWFAKPPGVKLSSKLLAGIDVKTHETGYVVLPPSIHPVSGKPYTIVKGRIRPMPGWLTRALTPQPPQPVPSSRTRTTRPRGFFNTGSSIVEKFNANTTWPEVLEPHGWRLVGGDGDSDNSRWLHPTATSATSASVRGGRLYVYSPNTPFDVTETGDRHGHSKFHAYAILNHHGDMSTAARQLAGKASTTP
ncbi:bifunctional DNA primase/polymerase [Mycolicibacterium sp. XJ1819]